MHFAVHGPFEMPRHTRRLVTRSARDKRAFWEDVDDDRDGLADACGCYIMSIRGRPWYVGLAEKQSFRHECFAPQKISKYDSALSSGTGCPLLFLIAKVTPGRRFARPSSDVADLAKPNRKCRLDSLTTLADDRDNPRRVRPGPFAILAVILEQEHAV